MNELAEIAFRAAGVRPEYLSGRSAWTGHIPFAMVLTPLLAPRRIVELGSWHGDSYLAFCQAVAEAGLPTRCSAVDHWEGDEHTGPLDRDVFERLSGYHDERYDSFSELLRMSFDEALGRIADGTVDLLHIDGFHTYEAASHDYASWLPKLAPGAVVLLHDVCERREGFGVWRLWEELAQRHPSFLFRHAHGLGMVVPDGSVPDALRPFVEASDDEADAIRALFAGAGARVEELSGESAAQRISRLEEMGADAYRQLTEAAAHIQQLHEALGAADTRHREQLAAAERRIAELSAELARRDARPAERVRSAARRLTRR